jgi:hypothetical protein
VTASRRDRCHRPVDDLEGAEQAAPRRPALATAWSPEQISRRLVVDFPDDEDMRISHEAI